MLKKSNVKSYSQIAEYNSTRDKLQLKEYGRHVQKIIAECMRMKDDEQRNRFAKEIVILMGQINPQLRNQEDFRHKLWDHLYAISDYKLKVDAPFELSTKEEVMKKPERLDYPQSEMKHRHYGKYMEQLVEQAIEADNPEKREWLMSLIGNFMKLVYQNWSKESINDEIVKNDLRTISDGQLQLGDEVDINSLSRSNKQFMGGRPQQHQGGGGKHKKFKKKKNRYFNKNRQQ